MTSRRRGRGKRSLLVWAASSVIIALAAAGCGSSDDDAGDSNSSGDSKPIVLGAAIAQTSFLAGFDVPAANAAQFAVDDINAKGGVLGRQLKIIYKDTKSVPANGTAAARDLISQGADIILVSCDFDFGSPAAIEAAAQKKLSFSLCAGSTRFGEPLLPLSYTLNDPDITDATVAANFAATDKKFKSAYLLQDTAIEYTKRLCTYFPKVWSKFPGTSIAGQDTFANGDASIASQISRIKALPTPPDFIYLCSLTPGGASAVRQIRAAGIDLPILAGNGMDGSFWTDSVPGLSNFYVNYIVSLFGDDPNPKVNEIVQRFITKTGNPPQHSIAIPGYSVVEAISLAAERAKSLDAMKMQGELNKFTDEKFVVGPTTFTPQFHITLDRPMAVVEVQKGVSKLVKYVTPENLPEVMP